MVVKEIPVAIDPTGSPSLAASTMGFVMSCAMGMVARALSGTFSCLRITLWGWELSVSSGETPVQRDGPFGTFIATGMGT